MILMINYDLIKKVKEANGKFVMSEDNVILMKSNLVTVPICIVTGLVMGLPLQQLILVLTILASGVFFIEANKLKDVNREKAIQELRGLSCQLSQIHVSTSDVLLMDAVQYKHTKYGFTIDNKGKRHIIQKKNILVPIYNNGVIKEELILQEHEISKEKKPYILSKGSMLHVVKPVFSLT